MDPNVTQSSPSPVSGIPTQSPIANSPLHKYKNLIIGAVLLLVILVTGGFILSLNRSDKSEESAVPSEMDKKVASVANETIYKSDVWRVAREQYNGDAITKDVEDTFLDLIIERKILDLEAVKLGLTVTEGEISLASNNSTSTVERTHYKYEILKDKIMKAQIKSVQAFTIGYWVRPLNDPHQLPIFAEQRSDGAKVLAEANSRLRQGETPVDVAKLLHQKYPSLKPILALNGYLLDKPNNEQVYVTPKLYSFDKEELESSNDPEVYNAMLDMEVNEVRRVNRADGSGGVVIKLIGTTPGEFEDYDAFLSARKSELVKM